MTYSRLVTGTVRNHMNDGDLLLHLAALVDHHRRRIDEPRHDNMIVSDGFADVRDMLKLIDRKYVLVPRSPKQRLATALKGWMIFRPLR